MDDPNPNVKIESLIESYTNSELSADIQDEALQRISIHVFQPNSGPSNGYILTIPDLIEKMETQLTSHDDKLRNRATLLIAELLHLSLINNFSAPTLHLFVVFFSRRLGDYPSIVPSLHALLAIVRYNSDKLDPKYLDFQEIFESLFKEVDVQSYAQSIRQKIFELLQEVLDKLQTYSTTAIKQHTEHIGQDILLGLIACMDGEKDPRCLLKSLQVLAKAMAVLHEHMNPTTTTTAGTADVAEKIFDTVAVYFPITFSPPADDPFGITPDMLVDALEDCLTSHLSLCPRLIPFLIDQLTHPPSETHAFQSKYHSLKCLNKAYSSYKLTMFSLSKDEDTAASLVSLRDCLMNILTTDFADIIIAKECIKAISHISIDGIKLLFQNNYFKNKEIKTIEFKIDLVWKLFCEPIISKISRELESNIESLQSRVLSKLAADIISCSGGNVFIANVIYSRILPLAIEKLQSTVIVLLSSKENNNNNSNVDIHSHDHVHDHLHVHSASSSCCVGGHSHGTSTAVQDVGLHVLHTVTAAIEVLTMLLQALPADVNYSLLLDTAPINQQLFLTIFTALKSFLDIFYPDYNTPQQEVPTNIKSAVSCSIKCMKELLIRHSSFSSLSVDVNMIEYITMITNIAISDQYSTQSPSPSPSASMDFLVGLVSTCNNTVFTDVLCNHCLPILYKVHAYSILSSLGNADLEIFSHCLPWIFYNILHAFNDHTVIDYETAVTNSLAALNCLNGMLASSVLAADKVKTLLEASSIDSSSYFETLLVNILRFLNRLDIDTIPIQSTVIIATISSFASLCRNTFPIISIDIDIDTIASNSLHQIIIITASPSSHLLHHAKVSFASAIISSLDKASSIFIHDANNDADDVITRFLNICFESSSTEDAYCELRGRLLAAIIHKLGNRDIRLLAIFNNIQKEYERLIQSIPSTEVEDINSNRNNWKSFVNVLMWSAKAMYMRTDIITCKPNNNTTARHTLQNTATEMILTLLKGSGTQNPDHVQVPVPVHMRTVLQYSVGSSFSVFTAIDDTEEHHAVKGHINPFWKQKLWMLWFKLLHPFITLPTVDSTCITDVRLGAMLALCSLIPNNINSMMISSTSSLETLVEIVSKAFTLSSCEHGNNNILGWDLLRERSLLCLHTLINIKGDSNNTAITALTPFVSTLIPNLLRLATDEKKAILRAVSLECLGMFVTSTGTLFPYASVHPFKTSVIKSLGRATSDKKRVVRMLAAKIRNEWIVQSK